LLLVFQPKKQIKCLSQKAGKQKAKKEQKMCELLYWSSSQKRGGKSEEKKQISEPLVVKLKIGLLAKKEGKK
jgi:hypothetical protein